MGALLIAWRAWDKWLIRGTKFVLFAIGATFTSLITLEVLSRFVFSFSIFFTNAMARYLLVWFFLLGAGLALRQGAHNCMNYRLPGSALVVTVEPCVMCVGAMIHARVEEIIYGAVDPKAGAVESCFQLADADQLNHRIRVTSGVLEEECGAMLKSFFASRR